MTILDVTKNNLEVLQREETITSGSVRVYPVQFKFNADWDGLTKIATFRAGGKAISTPLDETDACTIPWEVLVKPGYILKVGVYGTQGTTVVLPTIWADLNTIEDGAQPGENAQEPTPSVYQQLVAQMEDVRSATVAAANRAKIDADRAAQIAVEIGVIAEQIAQDSAAASQAKTDALTAKNLAETAREGAETARKAAEDAANSTGANATAAAAAATRAEGAANQAASALSSLQTLYQEMQTYAAQAIQAIQTEGSAQVQRVAAEGEAQTAAAKEQADRAELAASRQPYPNAATGTWWTWDTEAGAYKDTGLSYGGGGSAEVFIATYGTTTNAEIYEAYTSGKLVIAKRNAQFYLPVVVNSTIAQFYVLQGTILRTITCVNDVWSDSDAQVEQIANKVTSLSADGTDGQYPSAKAVYDALQSLPAGGASGLPTPTAEDAGKVPTVNADGTGYGLETPAAGATPQRGVDYWTEADQQAIVDDVLAALPNGDEVSY